MIVDLTGYESILKVTIPNFIKLFIMSWFVFYKLPQYIFPQKHITNDLDRIIFNIMYMLFFVLTIVPLLLFLHLFSFFTLILTLVLLKAFFEYYFENKNYFKECKDRYTEYLIKIYDFLDKLYIFLRYGKKYKSYKDLISLTSIPYIKIGRILLLSFTITGILYNICFVNFVTLSDRSTDIPVFIEWLNTLTHNSLYSKNLTISSKGGYFFGTPVLIFILQYITNIDTVIIISLYPVMFVFLMMLIIYYVMYKATHSYNAALFTIIIFGFYCFSPVAVYFTGYIAFDKSPPLISLLNIFKVYFSIYNPNNTFAQFNISHYPYQRFVSGLAYELAYCLYPLYIYFFIMTLIRKNNIYLILYSITLYCIFTISGAAVILFILASLLVLINSIIFREINFKIAKKGFLAILSVGVLGNLWLLSILMYGDKLSSFGAAAPFLDYIFMTSFAKEDILRVGFNTSSFVTFFYIQLVLYFLILILYPLSLIFLQNRDKRKFIVSSLALSNLAILFIYLEENLGAPKLIDPGRSTEYLLYICAITLGIYYFLIEKVFNKLSNKYHKKISTGLILGFLTLTIIFTPSWNNSKVFYANINSIQYNTLAFEIYKIRKLRRPLTWTLISFVQGYSKVLGKGFHLNVAYFLKKYSPTAEFLTIPSEYIYIIVEDIPNKYQGAGEWFYRWRKDIETQLKTWITIYSSTHKNIKVFDSKGVITVYEIDNRNYIKYLLEKKKQKDLENYYKERNIHNKNEK